MIDVYKTIISQYQNSPKIKAIISSYDNKIDPSLDFDTFIYKVWDLRTCSGWALDNWGEIIGIKRNIRLDSEIFTLDDEQYRKLLFLKAAGNITDCSYYDINRLLQQLFEARGNAFVINISTMNIRYVFDFILKDWEIALLQAELVMPRPAGVGFEINEYDNGNTFGFGMEDGGAEVYQNFDNGSFVEVYYGN